MNIKYGELTIIYHKEKINIFTNFLTWLESFDDSEIPPKNSKFIFLFDDEEICDSDKLTDFNFKFLNSIISPLPLYFEKTQNKKIYSDIFFLKDSIKNKKYNCSLDFNQLFSSYSKFNSLMNIESNYNCIYYCHDILLKPEIFSIVRIKSNNNMPRYQFVYDSNKFTKDEIIYLIHKIFIYSN